MLHPWTSIKGRADFSKELLDEPILKICRPTKSIKKANQDVNLRQCRIHLPNPNKQPSQ